METFMALAYLAASVLFILALKGLSGPETARKGNLYGMIAMGIAATVVLVCFVGLIVLWRWKKDE